MTPVHVVCCLDGKPFVYPDGTIRVVVPGAGISTAEHGGQCEVRAMRLTDDPPVAADLDELERRDSVSPQVAALWPATQARSDMEADG